MTSPYEPCITWSVATRAGRGPLAKQSQKLKTRTICHVNMGPAHPNMAPDHVNMGRRMSTRPDHVNMAFHHVNIAAYVNVVKTHVKFISHVSIARAVLSWGLRLCKARAAHSSAKHASTHRYAAPSV